MRLGVPAGGRGAVLQVIGYGMFTSYQYPGRLDLAPITPPPVK